ncbi:hypothetical protein RB195_001632 [Necator americanus]|uniref:Uncharacterized protein n=1 Tax=Necator americanus TaxID=51031 RepID=A0ABR1DF71_NECAM
MVARLRLGRFNQATKETHWKGSKSRELGDGYKLIYHGTSNRNGVGIILNESFRNSVTAVDRLSDRLMAVKVDTGEVELRVVSAYAPQIGCSEEEKARFWEDLEQHVQSLEGEEVLLIRGDQRTCRFSERRVRELSWWIRFWSSQRRWVANPGLAAKREDKKAVSKAKSDCHKAVYDMLDTREGERAVYRLVRVRHRSTLDMEHTKIVKGADGAVLRRPGQILERWREYYNHLCNEEFCHPPISTVPSFEGPVLPITAVEVSAALAKMKWNKVEPVLMTYLLTSGSC